MSATNPSSSKICIASHNVQGLNSPVKQQKLFQLNHSQKIDVLLLHKTHFPNTYNPSFLHQKIPQFLAVAVCLSRHLNFSISKVLKDPNGRYIFVSGSIDGLTYTFASYYSPHFFNLTILKKLPQTLYGLLTNR